MRDGLFIPSSSVSRQGRAGGSGGSGGGGGMLVRGVRRHGANWVRRVFAGRWLSQFVLDLGHGLHIDMVRVVVGDDVDGGRAAPASAGGSSGRCWRPSGAGSRRGGRTGFAHGGRAPRFVEQPGVGRGHGGGELHGPRWPLAVWQGRGRRRQEQLGDTAGLGPA